MPWNAKIDSGRKCADHAGSDYVAARQACGNHQQHGEEGDLSAKLEEALRSGWSIEALKASWLALQEIIAPGWTGKTLLSFDAVQMAFLHAVISCSSSLSVSMTAANLVGR
jgi:hypothetical protein